MKKELNNPIKVTITLERVDIDGFRRHQRLDGSGFKSLSAFMRDSLHKYLVRKGVLKC